MWKEARIREHLRQQQRFHAWAAAAVLIGPALYLAAVFCVGWMGWLDFKQRANEGQALLWVFLPAFVIIITTCIAIIVWHAVKGKLVCPLCDNVVVRTTALLATKRCPSCHRQLLMSGRAYSLAAYERLQAIRVRRAAAYVMWLLPLISAVIWAATFQPTADSARLGPLSVFAVVIAAWPWLRTWDTSFLPQPLLSAILSIRPLFVMCSELIPTG